MGPCGPCAVFFELLSETEQLLERQGRRQVEHEGGRGQAACSLADAHERPLSEGADDANGAELETVDLPVFVQVPCAPACALTLPRMTVTFLLLCSPV